LVLRTHEGTLESREAYKNLIDLNIKSDQKAMQVAFKDTMTKMQQEKKEMIMKKMKNNELTESQKEKMKTQKSKKMKTKMAKKLEGKSEEEIAEMKAQMMEKKANSAEKSDAAVEGEKKWWFDDDDDDDWFDWFDDEDDDWFDFWDDDADDDWFDFWDDWFGDDVIEQLNDDVGITDWDDAEYDSMPSLTLHVTASTQVLFAVGMASVDVAVNTDLMYSVGATVGYGTSTFWFAAEIGAGVSATFMWDICSNPGDSVVYGVSAAVTLFGIEGSLGVATAWAYPPYSLIGIDFSFSGSISLYEGVSISATLMWCTTEMPFNARNMRAYCNPKDYKGDVDKEAPWAISNWDDDFWGWNSRRALAEQQESQTDAKKKMAAIMPPKSAFKKVAAPPATKSLEFAPLLPHQSLESIRSNGIHFTM
jgi:hypothetical protein